MVHHCKYSRCRYCGDRGWRVTKRYDTLTGTVQEWEHLQFPLGGCSIQQSHWLGHWGGGGGGGGDGGGDIFCCQFFNVISIKCYYVNQLCSLLLSAGMVGKIHLIILQFFLISIHVSNMIKYCRGINYLWSYPQILWFVPQIQRNWCYWRRTKKMSQFQFTNAVTDMTRMDGPSAERPPAEVAEESPGNVVANTPFWQWCYSLFSWLWSA